MTATVENTVAIIQARMSSSRLPGKVLLELGGKSMLSQVFDRVSNAGISNNIIVATSDKKSDLPIADHCKLHKFSCFRGDLDDVLSRFYHASKSVLAEHVVRITADCPLLDSSIMRQIWESYSTGAVDYLSNTINRTFPDGLDVEVFSFESLQRAYNESTLPSEREHVTPYIWKNPDKFKLGQFTQPVNYSQLRWTVDEPEDLEFMNLIYDHFGSKIPDQDDILKFVIDNPDLQSINSGISMNQGYLLSIQKDHSSSIN